jgi:hypothetical protein
MKGKLIKLSETHYIVADDSEIKEGDWFYQVNLNKIIHHNLKNGLLLQPQSFDKKITHSTEPFKEFAPLTINDMGIGYIPLSEVEELIYGYSVEKMAQSAFTHPDFGEYKVGSIAYYNGYKDGFNAHKELVKDNFILSEDDLHRILDMARLQGEESFLVKHTNEEIIQSLLPKTEWDIEITPEGKIVLL